MGQNYAAAGQQYLEISWNVGWLKLELQVAALGAGLEECFDKARWEQSGCCGFIVAVLRGRDEGHLGEVRCVLRWRQGFQALIPERCTRLGNHVGEVQLGVGCGRQAEARRRTVARTDHEDAERRVLHQQSLGVKRALGIAVGRGVGFDELQLVISRTVALRRVGQPLRNIDFDLAIG